jgi:phosphate acetyltransferase
LNFLATLPERVRAGTRIGFPEALEPRTAAAIEKIETDGRIRPVAVSAAAEHDDALRRAVAMLAAGELDGVIAGALATTATVLRAGLQILGPAEGTRTVSSAFYMVLAETDERPEVVFTFTDAGVVPDPDAEQLAEIADSACRARTRIVGDVPRVAFLSYATGDSAAGASVAKVAEAVARFRSRRPDVAADGPLQADAAIVPEVARRKAPGSPIDGGANVLVFPDLDSANIAYKLVQRLAGARALGPILQGLAAPLNDLSRGASVEDIVDVAYITALLAGPEPPLR